MAFTREEEAALKYTNYGVQTAYGTPATCTKRFVGSKVTPTIKQDSEAKTFTGFLLPTLKVYGPEYSEWEVEGDATAQELALFICSVESDAGITPNILTLEHAGVRASDCVLSKWGISGDTKSISVKSSYVGGKVAVATMATIATVDDPIPFIPSNTVIRLGGVTLAKVFKWNIELNKIWENVFYVSSKVPANVAQGQMDGKVSLTVPADAATLALLADTTEKTVEITNTMTIGEATYSFSIVCNITLDEPDKFSEENRVYALGLKGTIMHDATSAVTVTIVAPA